MSDNMKKEASVEVCHFAASNSGGGFKSYYKEIFGNESIQHRYLIKGGPGTGKSSLMKRVAQAVEKDGCCVEFYYCSSDAGSLDGIVINKRVAVLDATAPHAAEPELVGARDEIVNLGELWNSEGLHAKIAEIKELSDKKGECYRHAYRFLAGAEVTLTNLRQAGEKHIDKEKMYRAASRAVSKYKSDGEYKYCVGICNSLGMGGRARLDTYERLANTLYIVDDSLGTASLFLSAVMDAAMRRRMHVRVSFDPIAPEYPDAVMLTESGTAFVISDGKEAYEREKDGKTGNTRIYKINMKRFFSPNGGRSEAGEDKKEMRACRRLCDGLVTSALDSLRRAGEYHFALEDIYKKEMNFSRFDELAERLTCSIKKFIE